MKWVEIFQVGIFWVGFSGGNFLGGSLMVGNFPGGNIPGGWRGAIFLEPKITYPINFINAIILFHSLFNNTKHT